MKKPAPPSDATIDRLIGSAMCGLGLLCVAPSVLMLVDHVIHLQVISCSVLFGFPLLWGGVHYLFREH